jgi:hypothetical protein
MTTKTERREALAVRIAELHRQDWPRFSLDHIGGEIDPGPGGRALLSAAEVPAYVPIINAYLRHFVPGECPSCGWGRFSWGIAHGSGSCACGWPGTLLHYITDDRDLGTLICEATCNGHRVCSSLRGEHLIHAWVGLEPDGTETVTGTELRCPNPTPPPGVRLPFASRWRPPVIAAGFQALLWAHPYEVHARA